MLRRVEFDLVFKLGKRKRGRYFQLIVLPKESASARLGLVVGKKVQPRAIDRNRTRRHARELFRCAQLRSADYVLLLSPAAKGVAHAELVSELAALFDPHRSNP